MNQGARCGARRAPYVGAAVACYGGGYRARCMRKVTSSTKQSSPVRDTRLSNQVQEPSLSSLSNQCMHGTTFRLGAFFRNGGKQSDVKLRAAATNCCKATVNAKLYHTWSRALRRPHLILRAVCFQSERIVVRNLPIRGQGGF